MPIPATCDLSGRALLSHVLGTLHRSGITAASAEADESNQAALALFDGASFSADLTVTGPGGAAISGVLSKRNNDASVVLRDRSRLSKVSARCPFGRLKMEQGAAGLGPLEAEAMAVLWRSDMPLRVREVAAVLNARRREPLAYTTVMTVMTRLARKGLLARSRSGRGFVYTPRVADTAEAAVQGVLERFGDAALARFVERAELDPALRDRLRRLSEES